MAASDVSAQMQLYILQQKQFVCVFHVSIPMQLEFTTDSEKEPWDDKLTGEKHNFLWDTTAHIKCQE